jgi:hypothetical protein
VNPSANTLPQADHQPIIKTVQETWAEMLGLAAFGPDDDFFDMGGNSLMAAAAAARLGARLGLELPIRALLAAPTPAEMAVLVADLRRAAARDPIAGFTPFFPSWVVPLQAEGRARPVFVFPAGHHERTALILEARIAAHVGREHPFWGFGRDDPQLDRLRANGVPALVAAYVAQIRTIQEKGPYLLYGNCAGAHLAWEAARQLLDAGAEIAGILFFEAPLRSDLSSVTRHYRPPALPVDLTHLVTKGWHAYGWAEPWRQVALGSAETVIIPGETEAAFERREERIARHVREWIEQAEARLR